MVVALSDAASGMVLLALPLTAILVLKVAENSRRDPDAATSSRALEALAVVLAVGMQWLNVLMPIALLGLLVFAPRDAREGRAIRMSDRAVGWIVYVFATFAIAGGLLRTLEASSAH